MSNGLVKKNRNNKILNIFLCADKQYDIKITGESEYFLRLIITFVYLLFTIYVYIYILP